jgi:NTP pyrophosphatase (non-canonical NTP hydrolase)
MSTLSDGDLEAWEYYNEVYKSKQMGLNDYQKAASRTAIYKAEHSILYPALGLAGEAGEVSNKVKKMLRDGNFDKQGIAAEIGDVLWYLAALSRDLNIDLHDLAMQNLEKLYGRKARGKLSGSGDKR